MRKPSKSQNGSIPRGDVTRDGRSDGFARAMAREEFGRFYWNEDMAQSVARQEAKAAQRLAEARAAWKAAAKVREKAAAKAFSKNRRKAQRPRTGDQKDPT